jgi:hypothetical protein
MPDQPEINPEDIAAEMEDEPQTRTEEKFLPLLDYWADSRERFQKKTGLDWRITYDTAMLGSFLGDGVPVGASGDLTLQGLWAIGHRWKENPTELRFRVRHRHAFGSTAPSEIGPEIGSLWDVVRGFNDLSRRLQLLAWHTDAVEEADSPEGHGLSLTYERKLRSNGTRLFARASWSDGGSAPVDRFLTAGVGFPCGEHDFIGLAAGIGKGSVEVDNSDGSISVEEDRVQAVFEGFYRWHPRKNLWITPDVQLLVGEGFDDGPDIRFIGGLRARIRF